MTKVQLNGVGKAFGAFTAVESIDLSIELGELVALLGPSGCGKTTTLRLIAGLDVPSSGSIMFDGKDVSATPVQDRNVGMVFQRYALFPHMTVEKNVEFGLSVRNTPKAEIKERLEKILDVVQLRDFRHRFPAQLSGGQMQRVAIARTLITRPSVLMMDEPLASLDTKLRGEMRRFIRDLQQSLGITTIFVTHDQVEAMELADRVAVLFDGRLAQFDTPDVLYQRPRSMNVADFMGASNIFPGRLGAHNLVETEFGSVRIGGHAGHSPGDKVSIMLRAEALDIVDREEAALHQALRGVIVARDFSGASVSYTVACGGARISVIEQSRRLLDVGAPVRLDIAPERIWLLPDGRARGQA